MNPIINAPMMTTNEINVPIFMLKPQLCYLLVTPNIALQQGQV